MTLARRRGDRRGHVQRCALHRRGPEQNRRSADARDFNSARVRGAVRKYRANCGYAMIAHRHMHEYGTTPQQMAKVAVDQRANALKIRSRLSMTSRSRSMTY